MSCQSLSIFLLLKTKCPNMSKTKRNKWMEAAALYCLDEASWGCSDWQTLIRWHQRICNKTEMKSKLTCWQRTPPRGIVGRVCPQTHSGQTGWDYSCAVVRGRDTVWDEHETIIYMASNDYTVTGPYVQVAPKVSFQLGIDDVARLFTVKEQASVFGSVVCTSCSLSLLPCFSSLAPRPSPASSCTCFDHHTVAGLQGNATSRFNRYLLLSHTWTRTAATGQKQWEEATSVVLTVFFVHTLLLTWDNFFSLLVVIRSRADGLNIIAVREGHHILFLPRFWFDLTAGNT